MSFLSGLRPSETGINNNDTPLRDKLPDIITLPQFFKDHGYQTEAYGKIFHQGIGDSLSWDFYQDGPKQRSTYHFEENTRINDPYDGSRRGRPYEYADVPDSLYTDGIIANRALRAMDQFKRDRPFFLAVGFLKPHLPFNAPKKYWDLYDDPSESYHRTSEKPHGSPGYAFNNSGELRKYHAVPKKGPIPNVKGDTLLHGYFACVSYMDAQVGKLLAKLDELGVTENTIVVLFGDHGYKFGDFDNWCKDTHFDFDTRVPLIIHHPDKTGGHTQSIAELIDLYPTLVEAAGVAEPPDHLSGISQMSLFDHPEQSLKTAAFSQRPRKKVYGYSVRTKDLRMVKWVSRSMQDSVVSLELYDYSKHPVEQENVAYKDEYSDDIDHLMTLMRKEISR